MVRRATGSSEKMVIVIGLALSEKCRAQKNLLIINIKKSLEWNGHVASFLGGLSSLSHLSIVNTADILMNLIGSQLSC